MKKLTLEELKSYNGFDEIDKKVKFIESNRHICEEFIRELNKNIDLDYVKQSEFIEEQEVEEFKGFHIDENTKVVRAEDRLPENILEIAKNEETFEKFLEETYNNSSLVLINALPEGGYSTTKIKTPTHLKAVDFALKRARADRKILKKGEKVDLQASFVENVNAKIMAKVLEFGPIVGYGEFRRSVYAYGQWFKSNVKISDGMWEPTESDLVYDEINNVIDEYNSLDLHPIIKAIIFKTKFIKTHPFRDGNGRTSRILLNYMFVRYGYPTITIKGSQKDRYITSMDKAMLEDDYAPLLSLIKKLLNERCDKYISIIKQQMELQGCLLED